MDAVTRTVFIVSGAVLVLMFVVPIWVAVKVMDLYDRLEREEREMERRMGMLHERLLPLERRAEVEDYVKGVAPDDHTFTRDLLWRVHLRRTGNGDR